MGWGGFSMGAVRVWREKVLPPLAPSKACLTTNNQVVATQLKKQQTSTSPFISATPTTPSLLPPLRHNSQSQNSLNASPLTKSRHGTSSHPSTTTAGGKKISVTRPHMARLS